MTNTNTTYSNKDYESGDGMLTTVWGPAMWHYLHTMSFNYPMHPTPADKQHYRDFVYQLRFVLPCKYCRINLTNNLKKNPLQPCHLQNRKTFSKYIYDLHQIVNKMLHKDKNNSLTFCQVRERYEHFRSRCTDPKSTEKREIFTFKKIKRNKKTLTKEKGCVEPLYGEKSKCIIQIVPQKNKKATFQMDKTCIKKRSLRFKSLKSLKNKTKKREM